MSSADRHWWRRSYRYLNSQGWNLRARLAFGGMATAAAAAAWPVYPPIRCRLPISLMKIITVPVGTPVLISETLCRHCHEITTGQKFHQPRL